ncbi:MAG: HupE/UreJ family protein [Phycisphaerales bacterium]
MRRGATIGVVAVFGAPCASARAHLVSTELGPFYDGVAHTLVTPTDLLAIAALAILATMAGRRAPAWMLVALAIGWAAAASAAFGAERVHLESALLAPALLLGLGLAGAAGARLPATGAAVAGAVVGTSLGLVSGTAARVEDGAWLTVAGICTGVFGAAALLLGACAWLERREWIVVMRIAASWIAAVGLLLLGWQMRSVAG